ncbi:MULTISPECIES: 4-hydroxyphenylacetate 3-hydroxylase N-terminal domain-containing protein [Rhodococcus erythropolis group]|uniref:4-hydroxyphenylacetate 3-hydroxylase N-terminal domain-containing protein n=1 Tax=Rhodococcus erythropolis group TaxID=2840174 RepID=UPI000BB397DA|nr:4-hydroxyphenylacetate 3-hydroxylase N-terminal domain-containing protein [Rhodococcus erythropolis]PBI97262.1 4-hydroxybutyryl-CoA dehydratase/vinylacetyl-CoA-Delta-isomerase [Rhodococcus erythropolis]
MAVRSSDQYRKGLSDDRRVFYRGKKISDVYAEPELTLAVDHSALCYDIADDRPDLAVTDVDGDPVSAFYVAPTSADDLIRRGALIEEVSRRGGGTIVLKEVGSDALFALLRATTGEGLENARAFYKRVCDGDLALAVAQTDVKGDRSLGPRQQADPDLYLHIVDEDADSITVRGAKCHTSFSANADELIVLPTRAMGPEDADYAVSFAIPIDTPGLELYVSPYAAGERNSFEFPISTKHKLLESLTVFNDVRVPKNRVFLNRQPELAGPLALAFVDYHRFTAINYKLPLLDIMVGAASLIAEANGISKAGHVKGKITELITWSETVRGLAQLAAVRSKPGAHGVRQPDPLAVNMAKYHFAHGFHNAVAILTDLSGGLLATGPGGEDWDNPEIRAVLEKYYAAAVPAERRLRLLNFIADLTARDYGGYQSVLATHAEGSLEAEKLQISRSFDPTRAREYVSDLAGIAHL